MKKARTTEKDKNVKTTRKSKVKVVATKEVVEATKKVAEFPAYDEEAWKWMASQSIPGAYSPIMYIGLEVSNQIATILGRSLNLEEAQCLVKVDGPFVTCAYTSTEFQPVEYVFRVPPGLKEKLADGMKLTEISLVTGGAFYFNKKKNVMMPLSGSVFQYNRRVQCYEWCMNSPLVIGANKAREITGHMKWGAPSHEIEKIMSARQESRNRNEKIAGLMAEVFAPQRRFGNNVGDEVEEGLRRRGNKDHRNGRRRERKELQEN